MPNETIALRSLAAAVKQILNQVGRLLEEEDPAALLGENSSFATSLNGWRQVVGSQTSGASRDGMVKAALQELGAGDKILQAPHVLHQEFLRLHGSELCQDLSGKTFADADSLSEHLCSGDCDKIIDTVVQLTQASVS